MTLDPPYLSGLREQINRRLMAVYPRGPKLIVEPVQFALTGSGKRLRPILTLLSCKACGGEVASALPAAVAVELLHNFTLVHDDIMDGDDFRHGQPAVHARWDEGVGIITGDALFVIAMQELRRISTNRAVLTDAFLKGALAVCEGQALDKDFETRAMVTIREYIDMIDLKTGYMLGLAARLGAICASATEEQISGVAHFGCLLGRAFQVQDDLLEIFSDSGTMGKSLGSDLVAEKKTYLMIAASERSPGQLQAALELAADDLSAGLADLRSLLEIEGIRAEAEDLVQATIEQARQQLDPLGAAGAQLQAFADQILDRKK